MSLRTRLSAVTAAVVALAVAAPVATAGAAPGVGPPTALPQLGFGMPDTSNICLSGFVDLGPFGPYGPYGQFGPYGPNGPLAGRPNPIGNAAECGGLITFILRGGTLASFVQGNIDSVQPGPG
jgi:hypothetical protein